MNKNKIFYSYQYELNFLANHNDINKFDMYHYTVLDYIKNDLGPNYKFRNYKISGPNFSKVDFALKKIKNKNKTDYIKSKTAITFTIFSTDKDQLEYISTRIKISYPYVMHALDSIDLVNYISLIDNRINLACHNLIFKSKLGLGVCDGVGNKMKNIKQIITKIDPSYVNTKSISSQNLKDLKEIIRLSYDLELIFIKNIKLKNNYPLIYQEIINLLQNMKTINPENLVSKGINSTQLFKLEPDYKFNENNYVNKIIVYVNLLTILLIFISAYLRVILKK